MAVEKSGPRFVRYIGVLGQFVVPVFVVMRFFITVFVIMEFVITAFVIMRFVIMGYVITVLVIKEFVITVLVIIELYNYIFTDLVCTIADEDQELGYLVMDSLAHTLNSNSSNASKFSTKHGLKI